MRYQARLLLGAAGPGTAEMRVLADAVRTSADCLALVEGSFLDPRHVYRKWQGAHWALVQLQWSDGGWNCDVRPQAHRSSFVETVLALRGLAAWVRATGDATAAATLERGVDLMLEHHLLFHRDGALIVPSWGPRPDQVGFPVRLFDVLLVLELMADLGRLDDPRCHRALDLLAAKRTHDGGFPMEVRRARTAARVCSDCTFAHWGPGGKHRINPWVTIRALRLLQGAGRAY